ncbi:MAG: putative bifunctional diguanylate cyclase/phosphodiesterase [Solirubrobacteraceae bacterium]
MRQGAKVNAWIVVAALVAVVGLAGSLFGAASLARTDARQGRANFKLAAAEVASTLKLGIQHEEDLLLSAGAFLRHAPQVDAGSLQSWYADMQAAQRYPETIGVAKVVLVPRAGLRAWAAQALIRARQVHSSTHTFQLYPPGNRPYYCFISVSVSRLAGGQLGLDACQLAPLLYHSRDSGAAYDYPIQLPGATRALGLAMPLYRAAVPPRTVAERRSAFIGWAGIDVMPDLLLNNALAGHQGIRIALQSGTGAGLSFAAGQAPKGAARLTIDLHDGSTVQVFSALSGAGIFANSDSTELALGGFALSLLLAALVLVLGTGRARAMRLVAEKTGQLSFQALHDGLTELPNRALVLDRAEQALARARRTQLPVAAMFIDVDGFKAVNDTFGHAAGDRLLRVIAARLTGVVREADTVGRLGGDEFVVLLEGQDAYVTPELVAERLLDVLHQPAEIGEDKSVTISASIGIASGLRNDADELLRDADLALYAAKAAGKNRYMFFEDSMQTAAADRYELELELQGALKSNQLFLVYQPTFDLRSGAVKGVEALIRWRHPTKGIVPPVAFIPIAEENSQIIEIGAWVVREACAQGAEWHRRGYTIGMSVNVSARQVESDEFVEVVAAALSESGLDAEALTLEITETVLMRDAEASARRLHALKALGVRIAIDDFGTGYSSLAYLRQFPVDTLKIDRSFISGISSSPESAALTHTLVQLGKTLGLETLGEGIEENSQLQRLRVERCDSGQGFLLARPLTVAAVEEFFLDALGPSAEPALPTAQR